jgi:hypothetical protein
LIQSASNVLLAVKKGQPTGPFRDELRRLNFDDLARELTDDNTRKAFWINLYNAFAQVLLAEHGEYFRKNRLRFFGKKWVEIGGKRLSLNDLEHGLLRRSQFAYGLGYVMNPFASAWERRFRVRQRDCRVHFALNCGAAACPPIAAYRPDALDAQLELATASFLETDCRYDPTTNTVELSKIFRWFCGDFGGNAGIRRLLAAHGVIPPGDSSPPTFRFRRYDWSLHLGQYVETGAGW